MLTAWGDESANHIMAALACECFSAEPRQGTE